MTRILFVIALAALLMSAGCSCSSIPESPPGTGTGAPIEVKHNTEVSPEGASSAGTKVGTQAIPLPPKK